MWQYGDVRDDCLMRAKHLIGWSPSLEPGLQTGHFFSENGRVLKLQRLHFAVTNRVELSDCRLLWEQKNSWNIKKPLGIDEPIRYYHKSWADRIVYLYEWLSDCALVSQTSVPGMTVRLWRCQTIVPRVSDCGGGDALQLQLVASSGSPAPPATRPQGRLDCRPTQTVRGLNCLISRQGVGKTKRDPSFF